MNFDEFIQHESKDLSQQKDEMRTKWLRNIENFYGEVKGFLKPYTENGTVKIEEKEIEIRENFLGAYTAKKMIISLGNNGKHVDLVPIAADVIGAYGRIDMKGLYGTDRIVLVDSKLVEPKINIRISIEGENENNQQEISTHSHSEPELKWRFATNPPNIKYIPINKNTFLKRLTDLSTM